MWRGMGRVASRKQSWSAPCPRSCSRLTRIPKARPSRCLTDCAHNSRRTGVQFYREVPIPFYGFNRPGVKVIDGVVENWWRQGMMGAANAHYYGIKAFSETDQTEDLKAIDVPTLVMQGDDDQIVPYKDAVLLQAKLIKTATLKVYPGYPHGMLSVHADVINPDLLSFIKGG